MALPGLDAKGWMYELRAPGFEAGWEAVPSALRDDDSATVALCGPKEVAVVAVVVAEVTCGGGGKG